MYVVMVKDQFVGIGMDKSGLKLHPVPVKSSIVQYDGDKDKALKPFVNALDKAIEEADWQYNSYGNPKNWGPNVDQAWIDKMQNNWLEAKRRDEQAKATFMAEMRIVKITLTDV